MAASALDPVLILGYGQVGRHTATTLRRLQPDLRITIAGRTPEKAAALAEEIGNADSLGADVSVAGLGLPGDRRFSAVLPMVKDPSLHAYKYAQGMGAHYMAFSEFAFDIAPFVAQHVSKPQASTLLLLGHYLGGLVIMATLEFAKAFRSIDTIMFSSVFDPADLGEGSAAEADMDGAAASTPAQLMLIDGEWVWAGADRAKRRFTSVDGSEWDATGYSLLDVPSLAAATDARSIRVDYAIGRTASSKRGEGPSHEVMIDITGTGADGSAKSARHILLDRTGYAAMSGQGAAICTERLLGLRGGAPVPPGIYNPENILDPAYVVGRMREFGTEISGG